MIKNKKIILTLGLILFLLPQIVLAAPSIYQYIVNHKTKQCAVFSEGDECVRFVKPRGWEIIGEYNQEVGCPTGYIEVDLKLKPKPVWRTFCLLPKHSGSSFTQRYFLYKVVPTLVVLIILLTISLIIKRKRNKKND